MWQGAEDEPGSRPGTAEAMEVVSLTEKLLIAERRLDREEEREELASRPEEDDGKGGGQGPEDTDDESSMQSSEAAVMREGGEEAEPAQERPGSSGEAGGKTSRAGHGRRGTTEGAGGTDKADEFRRMIRRLRRAKVKLFGHLTGNKKSIKYTVDMLTEDGWTPAERYHRLVALGEKAPWPLTLKRSMCPSVIDISKQVSGAGR